MKLYAYVILSMLFGSLYAMEEEPEQQHMPCEEFEHMVYDSTVNTGDVPSEVKKFIQWSKTSDAREKQLVAQLRDVDAWVFRNITSAQLLDIVRSLKRNNEYCYSTVVRKLAECSEQYDNYTQRTIYQKQVKDAMLEFLMSHWSTHFGNGVLIGMGFGASVTGLIAYLLC